MRGLKEIRFCSLVEKKKRIVAKTNAVQAPRENVNTSAAPPNARTAAASHLYLRSTSTNSTLTATDNTTLRYADRKSTRLNSSHVSISYAVFCLKKKKKIKNSTLLLSPLT